jgi:YjbE family integral membrane protein
MLEVLLPLLAIIGLSLVLSGDNAVLVALVMRRLPPPQRRLALYLGMAMAAFLQIAATLCVAHLFRIPLLLCMGGVLLNWIALKLLRDVHQGMTPLPTVQGAGRAAWTIATAHCLMSLDNVLAVASLGQAHPIWIIAGLSISTAVVLTCSVFIADLMNRYPQLVAMGAGLLAWTGGRMIVTDPVVHQTFLTELHVDLRGGLLGFCLAGLATLVILLQAWRQRMLGCLWHGTTTEPHDPGGHVS